MDNILISLGGDCSVERNQLLDRYTYVFGVDAGTEHLYKLFFQPTHIIGDFDSIEENTKNRAIRDSAEVLSYSINKEQTDLDIALQLAKEKLIKNITIVGGEGKELDHLFANLITISSFHTSEEITWITKLETIIFSNSNQFHLKENSIFSILPLSAIKNLTIQGAKWNVLNQNIPYGSTKTLRNIALSNQVKINVEKGKFCLIAKN